MPQPSPVDFKNAPTLRGLLGSDPVKSGTKMTAFVESCVETAAGSAVAIERVHRHHPRAQRLLRLLADKKNILITTHQFPDPDALASSMAMARLLRIKLKDANVSLSVKGSIGTGYNAAFAQQNDFRTIPWDDRKLSQYDAILLLDVQPPFSFNPLPEGIVPTAVIDHHRARGRKPACPFCDVRTDVGATSSIVFSYYMELEVDIPPDLAAALLFAIETDLAGAAGTPGELDNMALSSLTLLADPRKLYRMRYAELPQNVYLAYAEGLDNAVFYDKALISHLDGQVSPEMTAIIADFLLRFDAVDWVLVTAIRGQNLTMSLRTSSKISAADVMRRLVRHLGEGGGHKTKAGGAIPLQSGSEAEVQRLRTTLKNRLLRALKIPATKAQRLVADPRSVQT